MVSSSPRRVLINRDCSATLAVANDVCGLCRMFRRSSSAVATSREGHRSPRSGGEIQTLQLAQASGYAQKPSHSQVPYHSSLRALGLISRQLRVLPTFGQGDDLRPVETEGHLLVTRQLDDEFQLLAGRMH